jgi:RNA polymerase sigma-70 factor (ECF subfamily)
MLNKIRNAEDELVPNILFNEGGADAASFRRFLQQEGLMNDPDALVMLGKLEELEAQSESENAISVEADISEAEIDEGEFLSLPIFLNVNESSSRLSTIKNEVFFQYMKEGRKDVFEELYKLYADPLLTFVSKSIQDKYAAEDIVQMAFFKIWNRLATIESLKHFRFRLLTYAEDLIRVEYREKEKSVKASEVFYQLHETDTFSQTENMVFFITVISELPRRMGEVVKFLLEGMTIEETAKVLGITQNTVNNFLGQARKILRKKQKSRPKKP